MMWKKNGERGTPEDHDQRCLATEVYNGRTDAQLIGAIIACGFKERMKKPNTPISSFNDNSTWEDVEKVLNYQRNINVQ